jgi:hypothetical protein
MTSEHRLEMIKARPQPNDSGARHDLAKSHNKLQKRASLFMIINYKSGQNRLQGAKIKRRLDGDTKESLKANDTGAGKQGRRMPRKPP